MEKAKQYLILKKLSLIAYIWTTILPNNDINSVPSIPAFTPSTQENKGLAKFQNDLQFSTNAIMPSLEALMASRSVDSIIRALNVLPYSQTLYILKQIASNGLSTQLTREDIIQIIYGITIYYRSDTKKQMEVMDIILNHTYLQTDTPPLLFIAGDNDFYVSMVPIFIAWAKQRQSKYPKIFKSYIKKSYEYASHTNNKNVLENLYNNGAKLHKNQASLLLLDAAKNNQQEGILNFFLQAGANPDIEKNGMTPLMFIAKQGDVSRVPILLSAGATINKKSSKTGKRALDIAIEFKNVTVEIYLRTCCDARESE
jgi:ankyrin repeat protein